jgi:hypothetical protein
LISSVILSIKFNHIPISHTLIHQLRSKVQRNRKIVRMLVIALLQYPQAAKLKCSLVGYVHKF